jgi:hypothetical protein
MRKALVPKWSQGRSKNRRDGGIRTRDPLTPRELADVQPVTENPFPQVRVRQASCTDARIRGRLGSP